MTATARRQPEGSLVYILDRTDLYLRVRDGVRQVQVNISLNYEPEWHINTSSIFYLCSCFLIFSAWKLHCFAPRGCECNFSFLLFPRTYNSPCFNKSHALYQQGNEVAAVEPPPVVPYSPDHHSHIDFQSPPDSHSQSQPDGHHPTHTEPRYPSNPDPRYTTHPDPRYQPDPRYPAQTDPRFPSYTERQNQPDGRYSVHTTQDRPAHPDSRYAVTPQRRPPPPVPHIPVHHHASGPGVREATLKQAYSHHLFFIT